MVSHPECKQLCVERCSPNAHGSAQPTEVFTLHSAHPYVKMPCSKVVCFPLIEDFRELCPLHTSTDSLSDCSVCSWNWEKRTWRGVFTQSYTNTGIVSQAESMKETQSCIIKLNLDLRNKSFLSYCSTLQHLLNRVYSWYKKPLRISFVLWLTGVCRRVFTECLEESGRWRSWGRNTCPGKACWCSTK